jgi:hypothetical protein
MLFGRGDGTTVGVEFATVFARVCSGVDMLYGRGEAVSNVPFARVCSDVAWTNCGGGTLLGRACSVATADVLFGCGDGTAAMGAAFAFARDCSGVEMLFGRGDGTTVGVEFAIVFVFARVGSGVEKLFLRDEGGEVVPLARVCCCSAVGGFGRGVCMGVLPFIDVEFGMVKRGLCAVAGCGFERGLCAGMDDATVCGFERGVLPFIFVEFGMVKRGLCTGTDGVAVCVLERGVCIDVEVGVFKRGD